MLLYVSDTIEYEGEVKRGPLTRSAIKLRDAKISWKSIFPQSGPISIVV